MKVGNLLALMNDAADLLDLFEGVEDRDQLVSRLEVLKRKGADDVLACVAGLRHSVHTMNNDVLEMGSTVDLSDVEDRLSEGQESEEDIDRILESVGEGSPDRSENAKTENPQEVDLSRVQTA
jgi:hypothetical protein